MINCIAIDDEPLALDIVKSYCDKIPFVTLLQTFNNPFDSLSFLKENKVDLIFLDIEMEDITGIQFLNMLSIKPMVIFTTAYHDYAIDGFELEIEDYLLKPFSFERFLKASNKVFEKKQLQLKIEKNQTEQNIIEKELTINDNNFIFIKVGFDIVKVNLEDIIYIEGQLDYLKIVTLQKNYMTLQTFKDLEGILPSKKFFRIHKSYIVSISKIDSIKRNRIWINDDIILPIGNSYKQSFLTFFKNNKLLP